MAILANNVMEAEVWIQCNGTDAYLLNNTHPWFCDDDDKEDGVPNHEQDDDDVSGKTKIFPSHCGNEKFEISWGSVEYESWNAETELDWSDLLGLDSHRVFPQSIGSFTGADYIWTETKDDLKRLRGVTISFEVFSLLGVMATCMAVRKTFNRYPAVERPGRWGLILLLALVFFTLATATIAMSNNIEALRKGDKVRDSAGKKISGLRHNAWTDHYPESYGCQAKPGNPPIGFAIAGLCAGVIIVVASCLRLCCVRRALDLDVPGGSFETQTLALSMVNPVAQQGYGSGSINTVPPPYDGLDSKSDSVA